MRTRTRGADGPSAAEVYRDRAGRVLATLVLLMGCATSPLPPGELGGAGGFPNPVRSTAPDSAPLPGCGARTLPADWPELTSPEPKALLAPFLTCASPGEYVALQRRVDMPRLVEALDDWSAVRLGALGPMREDASGALERKRAAFLVEVSERYGLVQGEVFALFVLHSAHDDEVDGLLRRLAGDKRLGQTLGHMPTVSQELEARGLSLKAYPERAEEAKDVLRGLGRAARDVLSSSPASDGFRYLELATRREQLPPPYQRASHEVERGLALRHFAPDSVALGGLDAMTFGVPLGFAYLVAGTGQGLVSLTEGQYEQAARELAPATLLVGLYAAGRGARAMGEDRGVSSTRTTRGAGPLKARLLSLGELGRRWEETLGLEGMRELVGHLRARREAAHFVAEGGLDAALALHEARGDVARARVWMTRARPPRPGDSAVPGGGSRNPKAMASGMDDPTPRPAKKATRQPESLATWVDEPAGLSLERMGARLARAELDAVGPRLPANVALLERQRPSLEAPPPGAEGHPRWSEYVTYRERRLGELKQGKPEKGPLRWEAYEQLWGGFARGMAFESLMVEVLRADAALPRAARRFLGDFERPRIERWVGVWKPGSGLRFADVLVIDESTLGGQPPRVETFSLKSRRLAGLEPQGMRAQMKADAMMALEYYGGTADIRRPALQSLLSQGSEVPIRRVRLIYESGELTSMNSSMLQESVGRTEAAVPGVEVRFH